MVLSVERVYPEYIYQDEWLKEIWEDDDADDTDEADEADD